MTKIYLVKSGRLSKHGDVYNVVENVFSNRKKAENYVEWAEKRRKDKNEWYKKNKFSFSIIRYYYEIYAIDTTDYSKIPF